MSKVAEAYKAGRAKARWTKDYVVAKKSKRSKLEACAIGAFAIGMGIIGDDDIEFDHDWEGVVFTPAYNKTDKARDVFNSMLDETKEAKYACKHNDDPWWREERATDPASLIEHYSDEHRNTFGRDSNLIALMDQYARN